MASIADVFFTAALDDARLQTDAKKAGDQAGLTLGQRMSSGVKKGSADLVSGIKLGAGIAAFGGLTTAISGVVGVLGDAVAAAREDEESQSRLGAALKANIPNWNGNTEAIEATIAARQRLGFSDDEQRKSLGLLVVATNDVGKALQIQAAAMDLARLKGISLEEASSALIKVEGGQFRALKALGIQLPKNATATEALAAVQRAANGSAEAFASTSAGELLASQIKVGEAMERLGYILLPVVSDAMVALADGVAGIANDFANAAREIQPFLDELAKLEQVKINNPGVELGAALHDLLWPVDITNTGLTQNVADSAKHLEQTIPEKFGPAFTGAWKQVDTKPAALAVVQSFGSDLAAQSGTAKTYGARIAAAAAQGLADKINEQRSVVDQSWDALLLGLKNQLTPAKERAKLIGYLASKELTAGLKSGDPAVRAQAQATKQTILDRLAALAPNAKNIGKAGMEALRRAMKSKDPEIRAAAQAIYNAATKPIAPIVEKMRGWGKAAGAAYAAGLRKAYPLVYDAARDVAGAAVGAFQAYSPPGPESPLHLIDVWAYKTGKAYADALAGTRGLIAAGARSAVSGAAPAFAPRAASLGASLPSMSRAIPAAPALGTSSVSGGNTYNLTANVEGLVKATSPLEIARQLGRFARNSQMTPEPVR